ncbi:MAG: hypothetical protein KGM42_15295 [Hyphomicrobiales bacterium]|nr:hypothetical protein [Hyphomicrobiales bacterium]
MTSVCLRLPADGLLRWHEDLVAALRKGGHTVGVELRAIVAREPPALSLLGEVERLLFVRGRADALSPSTSRDWARAEAGPFDLAFDLTGAAAIEPGVLGLCYDGALGDAARDAALLEGRAPRVSLARACVDGRIERLSDALPANERPDLLHAGRVAIASRAALLILRFLDGAPLSFLPAAEIGCGRPVAFLSGALVEKARNRLRRLLVHDRHWTIAWRRPAERDALADARAWPRADWRRLADDRRRYYADPLPFEEEGRLFVFCEEYPYATQKGVISVFEIDAAGRPSAPRIVLERPYHLSYPFVFRYGGAIWMMPETSAARTLELYRAEAFPDRWTLDRVLMRDVDLADATIFEADGRWWLTAASSEGGSSWDCLSIYVGPGPLGPWRRIGEGPVLIDASSARPAGRAIRRGDAFWRPAQDCAQGYGGGLALCRIDRLDEAGFAQSVETRVGPPPGLDAVGAHTLGYACGFEIIDFCAARAKFAGGRA